MTAMRTLSLDTIPEYVLTAEYFMAVSNKTCIPGKVHFNDKYHVEAYVLVVIASTLVVVFDFERYCGVAHFFVDGVLPYQVAVFEVELQGLASSSRNTYAVLSGGQSDAFMHR